MSCSNCCDVPLGIKEGFGVSRLFLCLLELRKDALLFPFLLMMFETVQCVVVLANCFIKGSFKNHILNLVLFATIRLVQYGKTEPYRTEIDNMVWF